MCVKKEASMNGFALRTYLALFVLASLLVPFSFPERLAAQAGQSPFGINSHIASRFPDPAAMATPGRVLSELETGWVREDFQISRIAEKQGSFNWEFHDKAINELASRNINIVGVLNGPTPAWMNGVSNTSFTPPSPSFFADFAYAVVNRYKDRVHYWEVWNEPDHERYWHPAPNVAAYATLLKTAYPSIKSADPNAKVLNGGLVSPMPATAFLNELANHGAWNSFDIISLHPYTDPVGPEEGQIASAGIGQVKVLAEKLGTKPIWATEFGWSTDVGGRGGKAFTPEDQASFLVRSMALLRAAGVERVIWYNLKDGPGIEDYGLVSYGSGDRDYGALKPSAIAFKTLNQQVGAHNSAQLLDLTPQQTLLDFESFGNWTVGDQKNGTFSQSRAQAHSGSASGVINYSFRGAGNDYVVFNASNGPTINQGATNLSVWVYGDGSGHALKVWLRDATGEVLQFRLGFVPGPGWQRLTVPINAAVPSHDRISGGGNLRLDLPARLTAIVLDDEPDTNSTAGAIYLDDMTAGVGGDAYGVRFDKGGSMVDLLWSPSSAQVNLSSSSAQARLVDRSGGSQTISANGGQFTLNLGPSPVYLVHAGGAGAAPQPPSNPPAEQPVSPPSQPRQPSNPVQPGPNARCFPETGFCIEGRIREFWEQNGGLPVFGYPKTPLQTETIEGKSLQVQWFERNRLELHPNNARPYDVLLGRLGADVLELAKRDWQSFSTSQAQNGCRYFSETKHNVCGEFLAAWSSTGLEIDGRAGKTESESLALWGLPLSDAQVETLSDGKQYTVQWFERGRFELHPENQPPYRVLMGLLGNEILAK
jgi:hypothetical protein